MKEIINYLILSLSLSLSLTLSRSDGLSFYCLQPVKIFLLFS